MKLVTFSVTTPLGPIRRIGAIKSDLVVDLAAAYTWYLSSRRIFAAQELAQAIIPSDMTEFLSRGSIAREAADVAVAFSQDLSPAAVSPFGARIHYSPEQYKICVPIRPRRIKDYLTFEQHKKKAMADRGLSMPELWYRMPTYTNRNIAGLAGPDEDIVWPSYSNKLDFEFEIAAVIGRAGKDISAADADKYIAGYTIYNDFSARDVQADESRIGAGVGKSKDFDQGNVLGPCIVTADEIDPANISMILRVNGKEWSRGNTSAMKFSWGQIIENASRGETIYPGDVFACGTMDGGCCLELGRWFEPGAVIEMEAAGIGILRNRVVRPSA